MSNLVAVAYPDESTASEVAQTLIELQKEHSIQLEDLVVAIRKDDGKIKLKQSFSPSGRGAAGGALWGGLIGLIFFMPLLGMAIGGATGAAAGAATDVGVDDKFMKELGEKLQPGGAAVFVLVSQSTPGQGAAAHLPVRRRGHPQLAERARRGDPAGGAARADDGLTSRSADQPAGGDRGARRRLVGAVLDGVQAVEQRAWSSSTHGAGRSTPTGPISSCWATPAGRSSARPCTRFVADGPLEHPRGVGRHDGDGQVHRGDGPGARERQPGSRCSGARASRSSPAARLVLFVVLSTSRWGQRFRRAVPPEAEPRALTPREREIVLLVAHGRSGPEIAEELHIAHDTVRTHVRNAMTKLGARSRAHLVAKALSDGAILE